MSATVTPAATMLRYRFDKEDRIEIAGVAYRFVMSNVHGVTFQRADETFIAEHFEHAAISRMLGTGRMRIVRWGFSPEIAERAAKQDVRALSALPPASAKPIENRLPYVQAFLALEDEGLLKRTDDSILANRDAIDRRVTAELRTLQRAGRRAHASASATVSVPPMPGPRTLRQWVSNYQREGLAGLVTRHHRCGSHGGYFTADERSLLAETAKRYMSIQQPSIAKIHGDVKRAFAEENERRAVAGLSALRVPSREAVRMEIRRLEPFQVDLARLGRERALRKHAPHGRGLDVERPLQRVEIDEWQVDIMTIAEDLGLDWYLDAEQCASLDLDASTARRWLSVAQDSSTRGILAMRLSKAPSAASALSTLEMAMYDKGEWADAVGAATSWSMRGTPERVVTDAGAGYRSVQFRAAAEDLGVTVVRAVAGEPRLRGRIERLFRTIGSTLIARLSGRTFSNVIERADHPSADRAALTIDDLTQALIRWTVDIYHNTPHAGLGGMTPIEAWSKGVALWGITPEPDMSMRRLAFGARLRRELQAGGITVLGVRYHSEELHRWSLRTRQRTVPVRWHAADLGAIEAEFDGRWREVAAVFDAFRGRTAEDWTAATQRLRADAVARQAVTEPVVRSAFAEIDAINAAAMRRANILTPDWSPDRIVAVEERLFIGLTLAETEQRSPAAPDGIPGRPVLPHASLSQPTVDVADAPADAGEEDRTPQGPDDDADAAGDDGSDSDHDWRVEE